MGIKNKKILERMALVAIVIMVVHFLDYASGEFLEGWNNPK